MPPLPPVTTAHSASGNPCEIGIKEIANGYINISAFNVVTGTECGYPDAGKCRFELTFTEDGAGRRLTPETTTEEPFDSKWAPVAYYTSDFICPESSEMSDVATPFYKTGAPNSLLDFSSHKLKTMKIVCGCDSEQSLDIPQLDATEIYRRQADGSYETTSDTPAVCTEEDMTTSSTLPSVAPPTTATQTTGVPPPSLFPWDISLPGEETACCPNTSIYTATDIQTPDQCASQCNTEGVCASGLFDYYEDDERCEFCAAYCESCTVDGECQPLEAVEGATAYYLNTVPDSKPFVPLDYWTSCCFTSSENMLGAGPLAPEICHWTCQFYEPCNGFEIFQPEADGDYLCILCSECTGIVINEEFMAADGNYRAYTLYGATSPTPAPTSPPDESSRFAWRMSLPGEESACCSNTRQYTVMEIASADECATLCNDFAEDFCASGHFDYYDREGRCDLCAGSCESCQANQCNSFEHSEGAVAYSAEPNPQTKAFELIDDVLSCCITSAGTKTQKGPEECHLYCNLTEGCNGFDSIQLTEGDYECITCDNCAQAPITQEYYDLDFLYFQSYTVVNT